MTQQLRLNVKIFTDQIGQNGNAVLPDNNIYIQVYGSNLNECHLAIRHAVKEFAALVGVSVDNVKYYIFGDSDAKKVQLAFNDYREATGQQIRTMQDQIKFMRKIMAIPARAVYSEKKAL